MPHRKLFSSQIKTFQKTIYDFYKNNRRSFPWRNTTNPYKILVSEIMLQQTQTQRVEQKYKKFITKFPNFKSLANASLKEVLQAWQGLGYNRRALALHEISIKVVEDYKSKLPTDPSILQTFKGIGPNTTASICAFAFNLPTIFIETNIRTVFIYYFFKNEKEVHDRELLPLVFQTLDQKNPRIWYYALMDYGVYLKKTYHNPSRKSFHYTKQSKFQGSDRQVRGKILTLLLTKETWNYRKLKQHFIQIDKIRLKKILNDLVKEKLIASDGSVFFLH